MIRRGPPRRRGVGIGTLAAGVGIGALAASASRPRYTTYAPPPPPPPVHHTTTVYQQQPNVIGTPQMVLDPVTGHYIPVAVAPQGVPTTTTTTTYHQPGYYY